MLEKYQKLMNNYDEVDNKFINELNGFSKNIEEVKNNVDKINTDLNSVNIIIRDIDSQFEEKTGICNKKDMKFLWGAVALQCCRWVFIPNINKETLTPTVDDRKNATSEGEKDRTKTGKQLDKERELKKDNKYVDKELIMHLPVPYDAMIGTEDIEIKGVTPKGKNLYGGNHHSATWGHDPILGHLIGTANILTRSISFRDKAMTTRIVENPSGRSQYVINEPYGLINMCNDVVESLKEDRGRLRVAHLKQVLHLQSDKYTKDGLPIPLIPASMQQKLLKRKWNSKELEDVLVSAFKRVAINYFIAAFINESVGILHGFCYDEKKDDNINLYALRTKKIIMTSNIIAESINIAYISENIGVGIVTGNSEKLKEGISRTDIGGHIEAIHQITKNSKLQEEVRREFLEQELFSRFVDEKYSFLEEAYYEE